MTGAFICDKKSSWYNLRRIVPFHILPSTRKGDCHDPYWR